MNKEYKKILIELICEKQTNMIVENPESYTSKEYNDLEAIKIEIKNLS